jgi:hypothetical protein
MVCATYQEVVTWTLNDAARHAILHHEGVDDHRSIRISQPRIDFVDAANVRDGDGVGIGQQQVTGVGIPRHSCQTGR